MGLGIELELGACKTCVSTLFVSMSLIQGHGLGGGLLFGGTLVLLGFSHGGWRLVLSTHLLPALVGNHAVAEIKSVSCMEDCAYAQSKHCLVRREGSRAEQEE